MTDSVSVETLSLSPSNPLGEVYPNFGDTDMTRKEDKQIAKQGQKRNRRTAQEILLDMERALELKRQQVERMAYREDGVVSRLSNSIGQLVVLIEHAPNVEGLRSVVDELRGMLAMRISELKEGEPNWQRPKSD